MHKHNFGVIHLRNIALISGAIIFISYSILLFRDYSGISMKDTCLFYLGGSSVGLQNHVVIDLSPLFVGLLYVIGLITIIISWKVLDSFLPLYIVNTIYAFLLLIFYKPYILDYPPFGNAEWFSIPIFLFIELSYLAILLSIIFGGYFLYTRFVCK